MKILRLSVIFVFLLSILVGCASGGSNNESNQDGNGNKQVEKKDEEIVIGVTPWSSTVPPTKIAHLLLEDMGYEVKEVEADVAVIYTSLASGDIDVFMDAWLPDIHKNYMEKYGDQIDDVAISYSEAATGWTVPTYLEDVNSVEDIKGNEDMFDNKVYSIEEGASATKTFREVIEAYDLDMECVASSESGMLAEAGRHIKNQEPVVFFGWRPHPMFAEYDLKVLEHPKGFFKPSDVHVLANEDFKEKAPEAYEFFSNWSISIDDVEKMIVDMEEEENPENIAQEWVDNHPEKVNKMVVE